MPEQDERNTVGCASPRDLVWRSWILCRCLGLLTNYFYWKPSCYVCAQKLGGGPEKGPRFGLLDIPPKHDWPHTSSGVARG